MESPTGSGGLCPSEGPCRVGALTGRDHPGPRVPMVTPAAPAGLQDRCPSPGAAVPAHQLSAPTWVGPGGPRLASGRARGGGLSPPLPSLPGSTEGLPWRCVGHLPSGWDLTIHRVALCPHASWQEEPAREQAHRKHCWTTGPVKDLTEGGDQCGLGLAGLFPAGGPWLEIKAPCGSSQDWLHI